MTGSRYRAATLAFGLVLSTSAALAEAGSASPPATASSGSVAPATPAAASAAPGASAAPAAASATAPSSAAPPDAPAPAPAEPAGYREVDPTQPAAPVEKAPPPETWVEEPPLPAPYAPAEPPLPPVPKHAAPVRSLWAGVKVGWAFPLGDLWLDGRNLVNGLRVYEQRPFADFASSGPKTELDLGVRLARRYNVLAHWEYTNLGAGRALDEELGGQRGHMNYIGLGFRFSSDPDDVGVLVEAVIGYRSFVTSFDNGATLRATDNFLNTRLGFGADIRISPLLSLSPMIGIAGGFFEEVEWTFADGSKQNAMSGLDEFSQHSVVTFDLGAHFDLVRSER